MVSKRNLLFQGLLFRFHVKFQGCNRFKVAIAVSKTCRFRSGVASAVPTCKRLMERLRCDLFFWGGGTVKQIFQISGWRHWCSNLIQFVDVPIFGCSCNKPGGWGVGFCLHLPTSQLPRWHIKLGTLTSRAGMALKKRMKNSWVNLGLKKFFKWRFPNQPGSDMAPPPPEGNPKRPEMKGIPKLWDLLKKEGTCRKFSVQIVVHDLRFKGWWFAVPAAGTAGVLNLGFTGI